MSESGQKISRNRQKPILAKSRPWETSRQKSVAAPAKPACRSQKNHWHGRISLGAPMEYPGSCHLQGPACCARNQGRLGLPHRLNAAPRGLDRAHGCHNRFRRSRRSRFGNHQLRDHKYPCRLASHPWNFWSHPDLGDVRNPTHPIYLWAAYRINLECPDNPLRQSPETACRMKAAVRSGRSDLPVWLRIVRRMTYEMKHSATLRIGYQTVRCLENAPETHHPGQTV